jgi:hypothetical protein
MVCRSRGKVVWCTCRDVRVQLHIQSQLVVVHLGWLQQSANLHRTLAFFLLSLRGRLLTLLSKQLGVVAGKLLQRDEEISQDDLEPVEIGVCGEKTINERCDLGTERC